MSGFIRVCSVAELPEQGAVVRVDLTGVPVALVGAEGKYYAIDDVCSHDEVSLADGDVDGYTVECWLHGSRFDVRTGAALSPPAKRPVDVYDIKIEDDGVYLSATPITAVTELEPNPR